MSTRSPNEIEAARRRYAIPQWSDGLFDVDASGRLCAVAGSDPRALVPLVEIAEAARAEGMRLPLLVRFPDILKHRAGRLRQAFETAIAQVGYESDYTPVYPIKVNQQSSVVGWPGGRGSGGRSAASPS